MQKDGFFNNEGSGVGIPQSWNSIFGMEMETQVTEQIPNCYINSNWDNSMDQSDPFESALSSIVSSPVNSQPGIGIPIPGGENVVLKELIGRLGVICNSGNSSTNTSCYNTPLNSPPKLNLSTMDHNQIPGNSIPRNHQLPPAPFPADPGFVERAARLSCFGMKESEFPQMVESGKLSRVSSNQSFKTAEFPIPIPASDKKVNRLGMTSDNKELDTSREGSSLSEQNPKGQNINSNGRKRKANPKEKGKEIQSNKTVVESDAKRSKPDEEGNGIEKEKKEGNQKQTKENAKQPEPPKDYIHVRARRGEATDSHSLAERVRREKISERMKFLQNLVPGCNKVTGKALMLDEIINYVQSLQKQVEFLSMKLATVNYRTDMNMEAVLSKDTHAMNHLDALAQPFYVMAHDGPQNPLTATMHHGSVMKSSQNGGFGEASTFWENDLQSVVQTGFSQNQESSFHGATGTRQMKVEL